MDRVPAACHEKKGMVLYGNMQGILASQPYSDHSARRMMRCMHSRGERAKDLKFQILVLMQYLNYLHGETESETSFVRLPPTAALRDKDIVT